MATSFPTGLDDFTNPTASTKRNSSTGISVASQMSDKNDAIEAVQAKVGIDSSAVTTSHDYKLGGVTGSDKAVSKTGTETLTNKTLTAPAIAMANDVAVQGKDSGDTSRDLIQIDSNDIIQVGDGTNEVGIRSECMFSAYRSTVQSISDTTFTKIEAQTEEYDIGSNYDNATNYRFTAPIGGIYSFKGGVHLQGLADGDRLLATFYKNGSEFKRGGDSQEGGATDAGVTVSAEMKLSATDYVELWIYYDGTGSKNTLVGESYNYFQGHLVGIE